MVCKALGMLEFFLVSGLPPPTLEVVGGESLDGVIVLCKGVAFPLGRDRGRQE